MKAKNLWFLAFLFILLFSLALSLISSFSSIEEKLCKEISKNESSCKEIIFIDKINGLAFFNDGKYLKYAFINDYLSVIEVGFGVIDHTIQLYEPLSWKASDTLLWGLSSEDVTSLIITGDNNIQVNKIRFNGVWLWYHAYEGKVKLPVLLNAYDREGTLIYGKE